VCLEETTPLLCFAVEVAVDAVDVEVAVLGELTQASKSELSSPTEKIPLVFVPVAVTTSFMSVSAFAVYAAKAVGTVAGSFL